MSVCWAWTSRTLAGTASVRGYGAVAVIVGTLLGSLSYLLSAWRILLCLLSVLFALAVLRFPETGLLAALLLFPFLPAPGLAALLVVSFASYLLRLSRGKRNFRFAKPDGCFWFFAAASLLLLGGDTGASAALRLCCACAFPLCVNLLRSEKLLSRAARLPVRGAVRVRGFVLPDGLDAGARRLGRARASRFRADRGCCGRLPDGAAAALRAGPPARAPRAAAGWPRCCCWRWTAARSSCCAASRCSISRWSC